MATKLLTSVVDWLRKGYPEGIPPKDFPPLLALLRRSLTAEEIQAACHQVIADHPDGAIAREDLAAVIGRVSSSPPSAEDINDVAARLASVGWPLSLPDSGPVPSTDGAAAPEPVFQRMVNWLRAGYPQGVPQNDYMPILALMGRLSDADVALVARELIAAQPTGEAREPITDDEVEQLIQKVSGVAPDEQDIDRVRARLAAKGWPLG